MINKIVAVQGNHPSKLNPISDTSIFLANEIQNKNYKIFYYDPKDLSVINSKVIASGFFIKFNYLKKKFFKILNKQTLDLTKCKYILIRQDPPFNLEYISSTYILDTIKDKIKIVNNPSSIRNVSEKLYSARYQKYMPSTIFTQKIIEIKFKMVLMGEGSKILDNKFKEKISFPQEIDLLEETKIDICNSAFKLLDGSNKQEVVIIPKKLLKEGFFEKLFHFFK